MNTVEHGGQTLTEVDVALRLRNRADRLVRFLELPNRVEPIIEKERELIDKAVQLWLQLRASAKEPTSAPVLMECDDCDGCGWVEGGRTIKTTCKTCGGTGVVSTPAGRGPSSEDKNDG